jgi:hypothetical protein
MCPNRRVALWWRTVGNFGLPVGLAVVAAKQLLRRVPRARAEEKVRVDGVESFQYRRHVGDPFKIKNQKGSIDSTPDSGNNRTKCSG